MAKRGRGHLPPRNEQGLTIEQVAFQKLRARIEESMITGPSDPAQTAITLGVTEKCVREHQQAIFEKWVGDSPKKVIQYRQWMIEMMKHTHRLAYLEYVKSQNNQESISTTYEKIPCRNCSGTGKVPGMGKLTKKCPKCDGLGEKTEEVVTRKVSGQCGDPKYLQLMQTAIRNIAYLRGMGKKGNRPNTEKQEEKHLHLHLQPVVDQWRKADPDLLAQAKILVDQLSQDIITVKPEEESEEK